MRRSGRAHNYAILGILLVAFALRVTYLGERPVWYDEAFSVFLARQDWSQILRGTAADIQPPLYYILLHLWQLLGELPFTMRFLSLACSQLSVALVFAITRQLFSRRAATFAALFAAILPFQIEYAQELRMYALLELALLVYFYAFIMLRRAERPIPAMLVFALSGAVALYSQSLAVLTWLVPDVLVLVQRDRTTLVRLMIAQAVTLVLFLPWLVVLSTQFGGVQAAYWTTRPGIADVLQLLIAFTTNQPVPSWFLPAALFITVLVDFVLGLELVRAFRRGAPPDLSAVLAFTLIPPLLMFALSIVLRPIFIARAVILSAASFAILLGWLIARMRSAMARQVAGLVGTAAVLVPLVFQYGYSEFPRSPFLAADAYLRDRVEAGDLVLHDNKLSFFSMHYYDQSLPQAWLPDPPEAGSNTLSRDTQQALQIFPTSWEQAEQGSGRIWFVIFQRAIDEAQLEGQFQANLEWLDGHYRRVTETRFKDLDIFLYEK